MKFIKLFLEILGWLQITLGSTVVAGIIKFVIYTISPGKISKLIAITLLVLGFILGAFWATRIWKKHGILEWLSSIRRSV